MSRLKLLVTTACIISLMALSGCEAPFAKAVYMPPGTIAEVAKAASVKCWITNADSGDKELRIVVAQPGWYIARPDVKGLGNGE